MEGKKTVNQPKANNARERVFLNSEVSAKTADSGLQNKRVEPKIVDSDSFDSAEEEPITARSQAAQSDKDQVSLILRKLRSKNNLMFESDRLSNTHKDSRSGQGGPPTHGSRNSKDRLGMSGLLNTLFKEVSAGERMCDETYAKVNQDSEVGSDCRWCSSVSTSTKIT